MKSNGIIAGLIVLDAVFIVMFMVVFSPSLGGPDLLHGDSDYEDASYEYKWDYHYLNTGSCYQLSFRAEHDGYATLNFGREGSYPSDLVYHKGYNTYFFEIESIPANSEPKSIEFHDRK